MISTVLIGYSFRFFLLLAVVFNIDLGHNINISDNDIYWVNHELNIFDDRTAASKRWTLEGGVSNNNTYFHEYLRDVYEKSQKSQRWEVDYWYNRLMYKDFETINKMQEVFMKDVDLKHELRLIKDKDYEVIKENYTLLHDLISDIIICKESTPNLAQLAFLTEIKNRIPTDFQQSGFHIPAIPYWCLPER